MFDYGYGGDRIKGPIPEWGAHEVPDLVADRVLERHIPKPRIEVDSGQIAISRLVERDHDLRGVAAHVEDGTVLADSLFKELNRRKDIPTLDEVADHQSVSEASPF